MSIPADNMFGPSVASARIADAIIPAGNSADECSSTERYSARDLTDGVYFGLLLASANGAAPECKGGGKREFPEKTPPTNGIVRKSGVTRPGIELAVCHGGRRAETSGISRNRRPGSFANSFEDKLNLNLVYIQVCVSIEPLFVRQDQDEFEPVQNLQENKAQMSRYLVWGKTGASANEQLTLECTKDCGVWFVARSICEISGSRAGYISRLNVRPGVLRGKCWYTVRAVPGWQDVCVCVCVCGDRGRRGRCPWRGVLDVAGSRRVSRLLRGVATVYTFARRANWVTRQHRPRRHRHLDSTSDSCPSLAFIPLLSVYSTQVGSTMLSVRQLQFFANAVYLPAPITTYLVLSSSATNPVASASEITFSDNSRRARGGVVVRLLASQRGETGFDSRRGRPRIFACANRSGRSAGFLWGLPFPLLLHSGAILHFHLAPPLSAFKTSILASGRIFTRKTGGPNYSRSDTKFDPRALPYQRDLRVMSSLRGHLLCDRTL
ncbi:hypothetical protein PR048_004210 [Dryococelus australis]|uniref:Uncharacterized protein n=1 Tax=Dryococelus australis TaxID=614101 RepID=A0ABQ9I5N9_9NEOP|nr:hypothetical protein PR048_004210 [Dryococelus australis]